MVKQYLACPRCFYLKYVLKLDEAKTSQLYIGDTIHNALEAYNKASATAEAEGAPPPDVEWLVDRGLAMARLEMTGDEGDQARLDQIEAQLRLYDREFTDDSQLLEAEMKVEMPWAIDGAPIEGAGHQFIAKIDRVDLLPTGEHRIVDFKTGYASKALTEPAKTDLQLCIYLLAVKHAFSMDETPEGSAEYWVLSTGDRGVLRFADMNLDKAVEKIDKAAKGMLAGEFEQGRQCRGMCGLLD